VETWIKDSTILQKVNINVLILGYPSDELSAFYLESKESLITVIVDENFVAAVKRAWKEIQARHEQETNHCSKESVNPKKYTVKVESLPCITNQSRTIVCGGQLSIKVIEVPKRLNGEDVPATKKVCEGEKGMLLSLIAKNEHSTTKGS